MTWSLFGGLSNLDVESGGGA